MSLTFPCAAAVCHQVRVLRVGVPPLVPAMSTGMTESTTADVVPEVVSRELACAYRKELATQRANRGTGESLDAAQMVTRLVSLRRRVSTLAPRYRVADKKVLDALEAELPRHVTAEADRVIGALTAEIRAVGDAVVAAQKKILKSQDEIFDEVQAVRSELGALYRGDFTLDQKASVDQQLAAVSLAQTALTAQKKDLAEKKRILTAAKRAQREAEPKRSRGASSSGSRVEGSPAPRPRKKPTPMTGSASSGAPPTALPVVTPRSSEVTPTTSEPVKAGAPATAETGVRAKVTRKGNKRRLLLEDETSDESDGSVMDDEMPPGALPDEPLSDPDEADSDEQTSTSVWPSAPVVFAEPPVEEKRVAADPLDVGEFNKLMEELDAAEEHPVWVEKYARDAEEEAGGSLSKVDRLRREGWRLGALSTRYKEWKTQYEKVMLSKAMAASQSRARDLDDELTPSEAAEYRRWKERQLLHAMDASRESRRLDI